MQKAENYRPAHIEFDVATDGSLMPESFGVYEGKMWKTSHIQSKKTFFILHWFGFSDIPDRCSHNTRDILILN